MRQGYIVVSCYRFLKGVSKMLFIIIRFIALITYFAAAALAGRHYIHMFQLNSYKPKVQAKWVLNNISAYLVFLWCATTAEAIISIVLKEKAAVLLAFAYPVTMAIAALTVLPKKHYKTPLKCTMRVKRLIVTMAAIYLLPIIPLFISESYIVSAMAVMMLFLFLIPWFMLIANALNRPLELLINRWYIGDAKKILKSCPNLTVIGITGSFGKTSVKYFLDTLLSVKYNVLKTPGNFNTPLGVVRTIRDSLRATHEIFLCEMGAKNVGDIKEICDIVRPKHGIITSVGPMHLESFKTIENVRKTKFELADALPEGGMLFLNYDSEEVLLANHRHTHVAYGIDDRSGYYVTDLSISERGSQFTVHAPGGDSCTYRTELIGRHNVVNICGAIAVANSLGISLEELKPAVRRLESVPHRLQLINKGGMTIIDDAYNSNPSGTKAALEALSMAQGMKIMVTPGMIELGDKEYELNREFGRNAAKVCDYIALVGEKQTRAIYDGLKEAGFSEEKIFIARDLKCAMDNVYSLSNDDKRKIILLENDLPDNY